VNLDGGRFVQLANDTGDQVQLSTDGRWAIAFDDSPYWMDRDQPDNREDVYRVDPTTGERTLIVQALVTSMGISPDSKWFLYWQDREVQAYGLGTGETINLTEVAGGTDFENKEFDRPVQKPTYGIGAWSADGEYVFLNTRFDVWQVPLEDGEARNLTGGMGARDQIRFRVMDLDPEEEGIDTGEPILLSAYGERTKKSGYFQAQPGNDPRELLFEDAMLGTPGFRGGGFRKAKDAERVIFTRQTFVEFPDYWTSNLRFRQPRQVTDANPQQSEYLWGERVLVEYTDDRGNELQATLALPAGYEPGRQYPMVVYFYEKMSQRHHEYSMPTYDDRPHMSTYASNGYLVLMPDIVYDMGYPGSSALDDVVSASEATIEAGYADPDRICLQGHSWGGYETSFIVTQTDMFACVVTGAPLTNLVSMHNILYKQSGNPNAGLIEWGQGRMDTTPFHDLDRYIAESPIHNVEGISTPFLILHGTDDGAVDWNQGLEYYIAARRMGKEVILLSYPGEPHHLSREENQKDFQIRMKQYFDHYLMDAPAPTWMKEGVPFLEKDRIGPKDGSGW
jgi:dipeptidyl aminopeptidase/acylaminoacyl peptidase